jgi:hypothetical protein
LGDGVVPEPDEGVEDDEEAEEADAGAGDEPDPLLAPTSCPIVLCRLIAGEPPDWPPAEEELAGLARPVDGADDAVAACGVACWLPEAVEALAGRLAAEAVQPLCDGWEPAGAYGGSPPGSGGQVPGLDGSGELTPG